MAKLQKKTIASALEVSPGMISRYIKAGMPVTTIEAALEWRARNVRHRLPSMWPSRARPAEAAAAGEDALADFQAERTRLTKAQADKAEMEAQQLRGELVRADLVVLEWADMIGAARARLLALPSAIAHRIAPPGKTAEAMALAKEAVNEALTELAGDGLPAAPLPRGNGSR